MTPKKQARANIAQELTRQMTRKRAYISANKYEMARLTEKQTILKREVAEIQNLISDLETISPS